MECPVSDYFYEPRKGHGLPHDPFKAIVAPRPIGWISSLDAAGRPNLAPYSFFNAFCTFPPIVGFASERRKDSVDNVEATGEFVCNLVGMELAEAMNATSAGVPHGEDEMALAGLEAAACTVVKPPRVAKAAAALECKLLQVVRLAGADGIPLDNWLVLGEVVGVHIADRVLVDGRFDTAAAQPVARCGYRGDYAVVTGLFEMIRPA
jgi:flavin reductase (DIM6/NTAB) family NADH-FMN oxidoreductase RutF